MVFKTCIHDCCVGFVFHIRKLRSDAAHWLVLQCQWTRQLHQPNWCHLWWRVLWPESCCEPHMRWRRLRSGAYQSWKNANFCFYGLFFHGVNFVGLGTVKETWYKSCVDLTTLQPDFHTIRQPLKSWREVLHDGGISTLFFWTTILILPWCRAVRQLFNGCRIVFKSVRKIVKSTQFFPSCFFHCFHPFLKIFSFLQTGPG